MTRSAQTYSTKKTTQKKVAQPRVLKGRRYSIKVFPPDDPIYTRGLVVGGRYPRLGTKPKSKNDPDRSTT